jgi:hypothetical protein
MEYKMNNRILPLLLTVAVCHSSSLVAQGENSSTEQPQSQDQVQAALNKTAAAIVKKLEQRADYKAFLKAFNESKVQKMTVWILLDDSGKLKSAMVVPTESPRLDDQITDILQKSSPFEKPAEGIAVSKRFLLRYARKNGSVQAACEFGYGTSR